MSVRPVLATAGSCVINPVISNLKSVFRPLSKTNNKLPTEATLTTLLNLNVLDPPLTKFPDNKVVRDERLKSVL